MLRTPVDSASGERLRDDVSVVFTADKAKVAYALWEVSLPLEWVHSHPAIRALLDRRLTRREAVALPQTAALTTLLSAQGCFTPAIQAHYTLSQVKAIFDPLRFAWYARYYAHPAWTRLREGHAQRNGLLAWLIHNYHISRAAGIVAARMASQSRHADWSRFFEQDALEEYWHCDAYYSLDTPVLAGVSQETIKAYRPLPASLAFEEHTLQVAQNDPLGHVLIAYFQESSIAFQDDCTDFYQEVEQAYQVNGLFTPWKQHIQIDIEEEHAGGLGGLLDSETEVSAQAVERALSNAWLGFYFLYSGLDDILAEDHEGPLALRQPPKVEYPLRSLLDCLQQHLYEAKIPALLTDEMRASLLPGLRASAFSALGYAREHDQLIICGRYAQKLSRAQTDPPPPITHPWCQALINHLQEAAHSPAIWLLLMALLAERVAGVALGGTWQQAMTRVLDNSLAPKQAATALLQLDELLARAAECDTRMPESLLRG